MHKMNAYDNLSNKKPLCFASVSILLLIFGFLFLVLSESGLGSPMIKNDYLTFVCFNESASIDCPVDKDALLEELNDIHNIMPDLEFYGCFLKVSELDMSDIKQFEEGVANSRCEHIFNFLTNYKEKPWLLLILVANDSRFSFDLRISDPSLSDDFPDVYEILKTKKAQGLFAYPATPMSDIISSIFSSLKESAFGYLKTAQYLSKRWVFPDLVDFTKFNTRPWEKTAKYTSFTNHNALFLSPIIMTINTKRVYEELFEKMYK